MGKEILANFFVYYKNLNIGRHGEHSYRFRGLSTHTIMKDDKFSALKNPQGTQDVLGLAEVCGKCPCNMTADNHFASKTSGLCCQREKTMSLSDLSILHYCKLPVELVVLVF